MAVTLQDKQTAPMSSLAAFSSGVGTRGVTANPWAMVPNGEMVGGGECRSCHTPRRRSARLLLHGVRVAFPDQVNGGGTLFGEGVI